MKGYINKKQIDYVLFHLYQSLDIHEKIIERFVFVNEISEIKYCKNKIIFLLSRNEFDISKVKWINNIPILFPISSENNFFNLIDNNLIFTDDILKSSFYLLSGYQEYNSEDKDIYGRYPFKQSIQNKLGIIDRPIVNYYFEQIIKGIELFCSKENITFQKKKIFDNFGFLLTHDIDRVDAYNYYIVGYLFKQLIGLTPSQYNKITTLKVFIISFYHFINIFSKKNPFWNFDFLLKVEKENDFRSIFFVLKKEGKLDARYSIHEERILKLLQYLISEKCEIAIHGTMNSALNYESMKNALDELRQVSNYNIVGCRQHFLQFHHPQTMIIQENCGLRYDTSLSFAEHEGFRNSYCLPYKIYHFDEDRMIDVWEFPLNIMEVTLFGYRNLNFEEALESILHLISEIKKFNGVFTLLWHNCFFDEYKYKGISAFYEKLIGIIKEKNPENITGKELLMSLNEE
jgi:hypothetical protein